MSIRAVLGVALFAAASPVSAAPFDLVVPKVLTINTSSSGSTFFVSLAGMLIARDEPIDFEHGGERWTRHVNLKSSSDSPHAKWDGHIYVETTGAGLLPHEALVSVAEDFPYEPGFDDVVSLYGPFLEPGETIVDRDKAGLALNVYGPTWPLGLAGVANITNAWKIYRRDPDIAFFDITVIFDPTLPTSAPPFEITEIQRVSSVRVPGPPATPLLMLGMLLYGRRRRATFVKTGTETR